MTDHYTENLAEFGARERSELIKLLTAWEDNGLPFGFDDKGVKFGFNKNSGYVFLTNENYEVCMMNGDNLQVFHNTPYNGHEGFLEDILAEHKPEDLNSDDVEYLRQAIETEHLSNMELPEAWQEPEDKE